jgi:hypothetical protein
MTLRLNIESFYPDNRVQCTSDLPIDDGVYEVNEGDFIRNTFIIKNKRIISHNKYNTDFNLHLITWHFEYLTDENGNQIHNVRRQLQDEQEQNLYFSTHWHLYPEELKWRNNHTKHFNNVYDNFIKNVLINSHNQT